MAAVRHGYAWLLDSCGTLAGLILAALAVLVSIDVLIRNVGIGNLPWAIEVVEYALFVATFLAAPWVLHQGAHVRVDLLVTSVPGPVARVMELIVDVIGLMVSLTFLYYGLAAALDAYRIGSRIFKELIVAEWWLLAVIPASAFLLAIEFSLRLARAGAAADPTSDRDVPGKGR
jgi:TRAP-type C4-dicarboxylate transport system permease small subunit